MTEPASRLRRLVLLRHAKSSWDLDVDDHERPLSGRGRRDGAEVGRELTSRGIRPDVVLCSTATRTRQTWDRAAGGGALAGEVRYVDAIYHAWVPELLRLVRELPDDCATGMLIGHAPGVPDLVEFLTASSLEGGVRVGEKFPTAGLAILEVSGPWAELGQSGARLEAFIVPRG